MTELENLKRKRGTVKSTLTRIQNFIDRLGTNMSQDDKIQSELRFQKMDAIWNSFEEVQNNIEILYDNDAENNTVREDFESIYFTIKAKLKALILSTENPDANATTSSSVNSASTAISVNSGNKAMLPVIKIIPFDGTYSKWLEFRDSFLGLIDSNKELPPVQKLYYLKSYLTGEASNILQNLEVCESNYKTAWELLKSRYENKNILINHHLKTLLDIAPMQKEHLNNIRAIYETSVKHTRAMHALYDKAKNWDTPLIHILLNKLDHNTRREWESKTIEGDLPTLDEFHAFLLKRSQILEQLSRANTGNEKTHQKSSFDNKFAKPKWVNNSYAINYSKCAFCKENHFLYNCQKFKDLLIPQRVEEVKRLKLCLNCLRTSSTHSLKQCRFKNCRYCNKMHNTLLHQDEVATLNRNQNQSSEISEAITALATQKLKNTDVLLATAIINVRDHSGRIHKCRALLDAGSQCSLITHNLAEELKLPKLAANLSIVDGIGGKTTTTNYAIKLKMLTQKSTQEIVHSFYIVPSIAERLSSVGVRNLDFVPANIELADPDFVKGKNSQIDILFGADIFWNLLKPGNIPGNKFTPTLQETIFGYIVSGNVTNNKTNHKSSRIFNLISSSNENCNDAIEFESDKNSLKDEITRFWHIENIPEESELTREDEICETLFKKTYFRDANGRFVVHIPFNEGLPLLGQSREIAQRRFFAVERKFKKDIHLKNQYSEFMNEYISLGHMSEIKESSINCKEHYFIPHHAVFKRSDNIQKIRVVFDASSKTDTNLSLNDVQYKGPDLLNDIFTILIRFRSYQYAVSADVEKMYRMIKVCERHRPYQLIFWRNNTSDELKIYQLNTVTYGMASSPFLAIRSLHQLADDNAKQEPRIAEIIKRDFYMDDVLFGAQSIAEVESLRSKLIYVLNSAGLNLTKWSSNYEDNDTGCKRIVTKSSNSKILGTSWQTGQDEICYSFGFDKLREFEITKRNVLSLVAKIFDPLGITAPVVITGKLIIQEMWKSGVNWDEQLPEKTRGRVLKYQDELLNLNKVRIPRFALVDGFVSAQLHGFCDASKVAYGACVYLRSINEAGEIKVQLLCAKSRVAPMKQQSLSIPRLELCSALLLTNLVNCVKRILNINECFYWCDSQVAIYWIKSSSNKHKTFIANRISKIQSQTISNQWYYVNTKENPADMISRGCSVSRLTNYTFWFNGPHWLAQSKEMWPYLNFEINTNLIDTDLEIKLVHSLTVKEQFELFSKFSNLHKLVRVFAYIKRFIKILRTKQKYLVLEIDANEYRTALDDLIKIAQRENFTEDFSNLSKNKSVSNQSSLLKLNPFLDRNQILRVGGRLQNSALGYDNKHQIILPKNHRLTELIIINEHNKLLHSGVQLTLSAIRTRYWPIAGAEQCKKIIRKCIKCFRMKPRGTVPIMGNLPPERVQISSPFLNTGVDYAGPILIKNKTGRGSKLVKSYICVFVCLAVKCIHLEVTTELTTAAFLNAFKRFIARRGLPKTMFSDNGKNFVGANAEISSLYDALKENQTEITSALASQGIEWKFIPPRAPNFGGIWEAAVKSVKSLLCKTISVPLTYEELLTVLVQAEGILNSRPLCPISQDPHDFSALTPAHFTIGRAINCIPEPSYQDVNINRLDRYQLTQRIISEFWQKWTKQYLSLLQVRQKWTKRMAKEAIKVGQLVMVHQDGLPPFKWPLGRITRIVSGSDGEVRVVDVKLKESQVTRPVTKIFVLPLNSDPLDPRAEDVGAKESADDDR